MLTKWISYARYKIFLDKFTSDEYYCQYLFSDEIKSKIFIPFDKYKLDLNRNSKLNVMLFSLDFINSNNDILFIFDENSEIENYLDDVNELNSILTDCKNTIIYVSKHINKNLIFDNYFILRDGDLKISNDDFNINYIY